MRPSAANRRNFAWHALFASLIIGLPSVRAHAGVVIGPGMIPVAGHSVLHRVDCAASAARATLGLNHSDFPVTCHPFTLDWLAQVSSPWPSPDGPEETPADTGHPPPADKRLSSIQGAKWLGVCGALLLFLRRSHRR